MTAAFIELKRIDADGRAHQVLVSVDKIVSIEPGGVAGTTCITLTDHTAIRTHGTTKEIADRLRSVGCHVAFSEVPSCPAQL